MSEKAKNTARHIWNKVKTKLEIIVRRGEYLEIVDSTIEHLIFPIMDELRFSEFMDVENMLICLEKVSITS